MNTSPKEPNRLSIGYVDDITHLFAADTTLEATIGIEDLGWRTIDWGRKMGSKFYKKKTKFMLFNSPEGEQRQAKFGEEQLRPTTKEETHPANTRVLRELHEEVSSYPSSIHKLLEREKIVNNLNPRPELINPFPTKPWRKILEIRNIGATKLEAEESIKHLVRNRKSQETLIFTDGSDIPDKGKGAAAVAVPLGLTITSTTPATNYEAELAGIKLAIELIRRELYARRDKGEQMGEVHILCNNQAALRKVADPTKPSAGQHLYLPTSNELLLLSQLTPIHLMWCPGHMGIEGNKEGCIQPISPMANDTSQKGQNQTMNFKRKQTREIHA
ncbi:hypothetical protein O181_035765 [Austropuccinia psidii MF-1]|uniref:RNase H type-1 domain-containing protein n=1 Tax=Austropuccinia psidii MF-1 TaxID=1389203 RepID=A0A9Q3D5B4_9BASI|nr:hypothetical protein [Austropuccinia psidii MF-1]